jgi:hypothetical protein
MPVEEIHSFYKERRLENVYVNSLFKEKLSLRKDLFFKRIKTFSILSSFLIKL